MIWFSGYFEIKDRSPVTLIGSYNPPDEISSQTQNIIEINIEIDGTSTLLFSKNPSMMHSENPTAEEVYLKYSNKIRKMIKYISDDNIETLLNKFKVK